MSKCDITISTSKTNYKSGDTLKGHVTVEVNSECKCNGLTLAKRWATHGKGNKSSGGNTDTVLFKGVWQPGKYEYPFSYVLKEGPFSYRGHFINLDWYLSVQADIPWSIDPKAETEFILEKALDEVPMDFGSYHSNTANRRSVGKTDFKYFTFIPLIFVIAGLLLIYFEGAYVFGSVFSGVGTIIFYKMLQSTLAERKLGKVECVVDSDQLRPGDDFNFSIGFTPKSNLKINDVKVTLLGQEVAISGSGTNKSTHIHTFHSTQLKMLLQGDYSKDMPVRDRLRMQIPDDAPASFNIGDNEIRWQVLVVIDIPGWPDWSSDVPLTILP